MLKQCGSLKDCGFFRHFQGNDEVVKQGWISIYCESLEKSEKCKRKQILKKTGKKPADNMAPTGKLLLESIF